MRELACGPLRPADLQWRLPGVPHSAIMRALGKLLGAGAVSREHRKAVPPQAVYSLTVAGVALLATPEAAAGWERRTTTRPHQTPPGLWPLRLIADPHNRAIILAFADGPLNLAELQGRSLSGLGRSALRKRVAQLVRDEILIPVTSAKGPPRYELEPRARRLGHAAVLAARWEWRYGSHDPAMPAADLASLLHLIAPVTHIAEPLAGICRLHVDSPKASEPDIYLAAGQGRLLAMALAPSSPPAAEGHATPEAWCDAVVELRLDEVYASGDRRLMEATLRGVRDALVA